MVVGDLLTPPLWDSNESFILPLQQPNHNTKICPKDKIREGCSECVPVMSYHFSMTWPVREGGEEPTACETSVSNIQVTWHIRKAEVAEKKKILIWNLLK